MPFIELEVLNNTAQPIIGIDLGTTNSLSALWRNGRPEVLRPDGHNGRVPSVIWFPPEEDARPLVGEAARERALVDPRGSFFSIKRFMGRGLADVQADLETVQFPASENERGVIQFDIRGRKLTPQELSALILMRVHDVACHAVKENMPSRAVITVPAYFDDAQRQATRDAAKLAGLEVMRIINEPTAASLAYGLDQRKEGTVAVYDLGGGTFDISILNIEDGVFRVLSTSGDTHLGGDDIDHALVQLAMKLLGPEVGELAGDPAFLQGVRLAAEKCKIQLSKDSEGELHVIDPEQGFNWRHKVTRPEFEALIAPLVERSIDACRQALSDAGLEVSAIEEVVLVGGSTRIPAVRRRVQEFFGRAPHTELNPDEVVALGAAVQGHVLAGGTRDILLLDVTPLSIGLETMGGATDKIIQRNTGIPCSYMQTFTTYADGQTGMDFNIVQGERELAVDCRSLGKFQLKGIPPMPAGLARIDVRFQIDANGMLSVTAREQSTGIRSSIEVQPMHGLTDEEVEGMLKASYDHAQEDFDHRHLADLKVEIGTMLRATRSRIGDCEKELDKETVDDIKDAMAAAESAAKSEDLAAVRAARDGLERATMPLAALLMDHVAQSALAGKRLEDL